MSEPAAPATAHTPFMRHDFCAKRFVQFVEQILPILRRRWRRSYTGGTLPNLHERRVRVWRICAALAFVTVVALCSWTAVAKEKTTANDPTLLTLRSLAQQPDGRIDFAQAKLTIDRVMDPKLDAGAVSKELDRWAAQARSRFPIAATRRAKLDTLLSTLYEPGPWNDQRPFRYDLNDPLGTNLPTKMLSTYLATRKGNCISMPILFLVLGQKLGLPVTLATAPQHVMVKYLDEGGQWLNVEATGGGFKYDSSYIRDTGISEKALANDIYLRPLTQRESVAVMMSTVMEFYGQQAQQERRLAVADLALAIDPKNVDAMLHKGAGNYLLLRDRFMVPYPNPATIPVSAQPEFKRLSQENIRWYSRAEDLGWVAPTKAQDAKYLESVEREKSLQGRQ